jgi:hypothetical protein
MHQNVLRFQRHFSFLSICCFGLKVQRCSTFMTNVGIEILSVLTNFAIALDHLSRCSTVFILGLIAAGSFAPILP